MTIATYRGVDYDTDGLKADYKAWWNRIHHDASRCLRYRGLNYRTCKTPESEKIYWLSGFSAANK